ncbi:MAG TPA: glycosyltransferase family 2 protein [Candidatus Polarisedimenticolaceae bacterium]|nr:glycosyltransferase family 2 protein [Candidatus Polarisedimenticolaceae bacterium]
MGRSGAHLSGRFAVAIPAFQAAGTLGGVLRRTLALGYPVVVVDDGSTDGTADAAASLGASVLAHPVNLGKGRALRTAFDHLFAEGYDAAVTIDADGQHLPEEIPKLLAAWRGGADLVLGTRDHLFAGMSRVRRASNGTSSWLISRVAGADLPDCQTGFRLYTRRLLEATGFPEPRFEAESAVLVRAIRQGFVVVGVPVRLDEPDGRATSHYRPVIDSLRIAGAVTRARWETAP